MTEASKYEAMCHENSCNPEQMRRMKHCGNWVSLRAGEAGMLDVVLASSLTLRACCTAVTASVKCAAHAQVEIAMLFIHRLYAALAGP